MIAKAIGIYKFLLFVFNIVFTRAFPASAYGYFVGFCTSTRDLPNLAKLATFNRIDATQSLHRLICDTHDFSSLLGR
jgi:hypothetical protein